MSNVGQCLEGPNESYTRTLLQRVLVFATMGYQVFTRFGEWKRQSMGLSWSSSLELTWRLFFGLLSLNMLNFKLNWQLPWLRGNCSGYDTWKPWLKHKFIDQTLPLLHYCLFSWSKSISLQIFIKTDSLFPAIDLVNSTQILFKVRTLLSPLFLFLRDLLSTVFRELTK